MRKSDSFYAAIWMGLYPVCLTISWRCESKNRRLPAADRIGCLSLGSLPRNFCLVVVVSSALQARVRGAAEFTTADRGGKGSCGAPTTGVMTQSVLVGSLELGGDLAGDR